MEKENYCDSLSRSSEEEINYCSFNLLRSHLGSAKSKVPTERTILVADDTDQQFWAEDELSSQESRVQLSKRKRRRSLAHRNRTYRSRSRPNNLSSSSGISVSRNSVEEEMKRNPELKEADLKMLKDWYEKQPHLPKISDNELILFLHSNYYRLEPTKTTIDTFYTVRTHVPEFFFNRDPLGNKDLRNMFQTAAYFPLEGETAEGYKIIYGRLLNYEPSAYVYNDAIKYWNMSMDLWMYSEGTMKGHIILVDLAGLSFGHTTRLSPMGLKKFLFYLQEGLPVRLKGLHFTNSIPVMEIILGMMKPFMKKELMDILHIHTTNETVKKFLPLDILPNESGGKAGPLRELHEKNIKRLEVHRDFFLEEESRGRVNESLRPKILDSDLVLFLSSNYCDLERAKATIESFYTIRTNAKEYFSSRDPLKNEELRQSFQTVTFMPLDGETPEGYKIFFGRLINYDPSKFVWTPSMKYLHMSLDLSMFTQGAAKGHVFIFDMSNATLGHSTRMSLLGCRKLINYLQEGLPIRLKGIHFIRSLTIVQIVLGMIKPFMKKEITQTVHVHTNDETLEKFVPVDLLPNESGGKAGPLMEIHQKHIKFLEDHRDFFLEEEMNCRVDESLRPRRSNGAMSFFRRGS